MSTTYRVGVARLLVERVIVNVDAHSPEQARRLAYRAARSDMLGKPATQSDWQDASVQFIVDAEPVKLYGGEADCGPADIYTEHLDADTGADFYEVAGVARDVLRRVGGANPPTQIEIEHAIGLLAGARNRISGDEVTS
jgi:hypothetical protein